MTEEHSAPIPTPLEEEVRRQVLPDADVVAARFPVEVNHNPAGDAAYEKAMEELAFGESFGDYMAVSDWSLDLGWHNQRVVPFGPLQLSPAASVLHYSQEIFEGMKAFRWEDGSIWTFRPGFNAARLNHSARRMAMPEIPLEDFLGSLVQMVRADERWVPSAPNSSLYLRPFMIADEAFVGVRPAHHYKFIAIASPVGPYFKGGMKGVSIWVTAQYHRAAKGGTGDAKTGGNYAASLLPQQLAAAKGFDQVCYLDGNQQNLEELGGMNVFLVKKDGSVMTPRLTGTILEGGTRSAIITLLRDRGTVVEEAPVALDWLVKSIESGEVVEMFACGTAAIVTPIGRLAGEGFDVSLDGDQVTKQLLEELGGIQRGTVEDRHGWMYQLA
ncbi:branched-chain amino acid aminotransferase [Actinomyces minihominis]|uniref:branched-chain amino acid aminotransferase n=1 Tax=Actinomyces minihominis TaxID=2002838 RepID=UPI000C0712BB|nr:branched-chain amino acid aminotransferase [Actinomyces minihominis]